MTERRRQGAHFQVFQPAREDLAVHAAGFRAGDHAQEVLKVLELRLGDPEAGGSSQFCVCRYSLVFLHHRYLLLRQTAARWRGCRRSGSSKAAVVERTPPPMTGPLPSGVAGTSGPLLARVAAAAPKEARVHRWRPRVPVPDGGADPVGAGTRSSTETATPDAAAVLRHDRRRGVLAHAVRRLPLPALQRTDEGARYFSPTRGGPMSTMWDCRGHAEVRAS